MLKLFGHVFALCIVQSIWYPQWNGDNNFSFSERVKTAAVLPPQGHPVKTALNCYLDPSQGGHTQYLIGVADYFWGKFNVYKVGIQDQQ